ncbi:unnamed protein product [Miscanthus lutarioriparius]|uniref:PHD finger protein ALFIN-LIKE n=1 Tax=Miscanthus lutarioriparius TaxID=422564 RepID=A0A811R888_9POAL|nr:unnamed protein product [Miscanthus lutarioriparius]
MDSTPPSLVITCIRSLPVRSQLATEMPMEGAQMLPRTLSPLAGSTPSYTAGKIILDFTYRRLGLIRAVTKALPLYNHTEEEGFFGKHDQGAHSLYLYGNIDGSWELRQSKPNELHGINLVRGNLKHIKWLEHIAMHGDAWLINISFSLSQHMKAKGREDLFNMINSFPTVHETFLASETYHRICHLEEKAKLCGPVIEKNYEPESEDEALSDPVVCSVCDGHYHTSAFWICCDICNQWYHGKCVKITAKKANRIKHYECPECFNDRIGHN